MEPQFAAAAVRRARAHEFFIGEGKGTNSITTESIDLSEVSVSLKISGFPLNLLPLNRGSTVNQFLFYKKIFLVKVAPNGLLLFLDLPL